MKTRTRAKRISAGHYELGKWTILKSEEKEYGYQWQAEHPDRGRIFGYTKAHVIQEIKFNDMGL